MTTENSELSVALRDPEQAIQFSAFGSMADFEGAQRMAKALYSSTIVPDAYRGEAHLGDCMIALEISNRIGMNVLAVMQNLYTVHGKPAWSSQFLIACVNASRRFSPLRYTLSEEGPARTVKYSFNEWVEIPGSQRKEKKRKEGEVEVRDRTCVAWAVDQRGEKLESPPVSIAMAIAEGWYTKDGSKWKTMPELMLRYRAATFFARLYAPELTMGIQTTEEVIDISSEIVAPAAVIKKGMIGQQVEGAPEVPVVTPQNDGMKDDQLLPELLRRCGVDGVTEFQLMSYCRLKEVALAKPNQEELLQLAPAKHRTLLQAWSSILPNVRKIPVA